MDPLSRLGASKYLLVTTFRKNGAPVPTPVWAVRDGDELLFWTVGDSGKVKRIRNNPRVELAECDARGNPDGEPVPATARVLDPGGTEHTRTMLRRKYGLTGRLVLLGSRLRRGRHGTVGVALRLDG